MSAERLDTPDYVPKLPPIEVGKNAGEERRIEGRVVQCLEIGELEEGDRSDLNRLFRVLPEWQDFKDVVGMFEKGWVQYRMSLFYVTRGEDNRINGVLAASLLKNVASAPLDQQLGVVYLSGAITDPNFVQRGVMRDIVTHVMGNVDVDIRDRLSKFSEGEDASLILTHLQHPVVVVETTDKSGTYPESGSTVFRVGEPLRATFVRAALDNGWNLNSEAAQNMTTPDARCTFLVAQGSLVGADRFIMKHNPDKVVDLGAGRGSVTIPVREVSIRTVLASAEDEDGAVGVFRQVISAVRERLENDIQVRDDGDSHIAQIAGSDKHERVNIMIEVIKESFAQKGLIVQDRSDPLQIVTVFTR
jgi:hypothetical protein